MTHSYDGNGNELGNSAGRQWTYNTKDQATSVTPPGGSAIPMSYTGTGQFERVGVGSTSYDTSSLGLTRENSDAYVRDDTGLLLYRKTPGSGTHYYLLDGLGSVVGLTDSLGALVTSYSYEPFGKLKSSTGTITTPFRWLGGLGVYHDTATGLYKMGTRYHDPALGRFTQVDPVRGGAANNYDYALQDPLNVTDLDGTVTFRVCIWGFGAGCKNPVRTARAAGKKLLPIVACAAGGVGFYSAYLWHGKGAPYRWGRLLIRGPHAAAAGCVVGIIIYQRTGELPKRRR